MKHIAVLSVFALVIGFQIADMPTARAASPETQIQIQGDIPSASGGNDRIATGALVSPNLTTPQLAEELAKSIKIAARQSNDYCFGGDPALSDKVRMVLCKSGSALKFVKPSRDHGQFRVAGTKICLHLHSAGRDSVDRLHVRPCAKGKNQRFRFHKVGLMLTDLDKFVCATPYALPRKGGGAHLYPKTPYKDANVFFSRCAKAEYQFWVMQ